MLYRLVQGWMTGAVSAGIGARLDVDPIVCMGPGRLDVPVPCTGLVVDIPARIIVPEEPNGQTPSFIIYQDITLRKEQ